jgi:hypothetical protein
MKINITIQPEELNGYRNISPLKGDNLLELQVENNSCREILANNIVDFIPHNIFPSVINNYVSKLRHGGKIILSGTSASLIIKGYINGTINLTRLNQLIYGDNKHAWDIKRSIIDIDIVKTILKNLGIKIESQNLSVTDNQFIIIGIRQ